MLTYLLAYLPTYPPTVPQACCYLLLFRAGTPRARQVSFRLIVPLAVLLGATAVLRIDSWPLTYVPMYSIDLHGWGATREQLHTAAHIVASSRCVTGLSRFSTAPRTCTLYPVPCTYLLSITLVNGLVSHGRKDSPASA